MNILNKTRKYIFRLRSHSYKLDGNSNQQDQTMRGIGPTEESSGHPKTGHPYAIAMICNSPFNTQNMG